MLNKKTFLLQVVEFYKIFTITKISWKSYRPYDGASVHACAFFILVTGTSVDACAIVGEVLQMLDCRADRQSGGYAPAAQPSYPSQAPSAPTAPRSAPASKPVAEAPMDNFDDDIPF